MTTCWGWIPLLDSRSLPCPLPNAIRTSDKNICVINDTIDGCTVVLEGISTNVVIIDGFLVFECDDQQRAKTIYRIAKSAYHQDITHNFDEGLDLVITGSLKDAVAGTAIQFVKCSSFYHMDRLYGIIPSSDDLIERMGMLDYGLSFLSRYTGHLAEDDVRALNELFTTNRMYLESRQNSLNDDYARMQSQRSTMMAKASLNMSYIMLILAVSGILYNIRNVVNQGLTDGANPVFLATQAALAVQLVIIALRHMRL